MLRTARTALAAIFLAVALGAAGAPPPPYGPQPPPDPTTVAIRARIDRLSLKTGQAWGAYLAIIAPRQRTYFVISPGSKESPVPELTQVFQKLHMQAALTQELSVAVCEDDAVKSACGPKFDPPWLPDPNSMKPTLEALTAWTAETENAIEPLRSNLCKQAVAKTGNKLGCAQPVPLPRQSW